MLIKVKKEKRFVLSLLFLYKPSKYMKNVALDSFEKTLLKKLIVKGKAL